jgi:hypothetical protein
MFCTMLIIFRVACGTAWMYQTSRNTRTRITRLQFQTSPGTTGQPVGEEESVEILAVEERQNGDEPGNVDPKETDVQALFADRIR